MPCRAAPPPPPPPHSTQDFTPSPAALSNPLVYRLRTCCLQEFLPRVSLVQKSTPFTSPTTTRPRPSPSPSPTQLSILFDPQDHNSNFASHFFSYPQYPLQPSHTFNSNSNPLSLHSGLHLNDGHNHHQQEHMHQGAEAYAPSQQYPSMEADQELTDSLSDWQPPASNIQLPQLQSALAHRFLDWALSEDILSLHSPKSVYDDDETVHKASETAENNSALSVAGGEESSKVSGLEYLQGREQRERSIITAGQDWAVAHDLVWPEGDYYMAKKIFIREGVAHLKRGRRYIFVEPVVGPATSYLYPKWVESEEDELESAAYEQRQSQEGHSAENSMHSMHDATTAVDSFPALNSSNASPTDNSILDANVNTPVQSSLASSQFTAASSSNDTETEQDKNQGDDIFLDQQQQSHSNEVSAILESGHGNNRDVGGEDGKESNKENEESAQETQHDESCHNASSPVSLEDDRAQDDLVPPLSPTTITTLGNMDGERIEKEDSDDTSNTTSNNNNNTATSNANSPQSSSSTPSSSSLTRSSFEEASSSLQQQQSTEFLKPYSPLLDPSTDGQDQFEYGLYELQYIPKIQYLLPSQFLPSRHSFIVHLDEDRPTLASPVPAHSKRSECRCQLMMRKVLMHRDLLQVWPPIPPIRTIQERQQEAEEEARMMEIKQKVQLLTSNWRKTLQTQMVAC